MPLLDEKFKTYERNNKYLLVFPDVPYWMVTNKGGLEIVKMLMVLSEEDDVYIEFKNKFGVNNNPEIIKKYIDNFREIKRKKDEFKNNDRDLNGTFFQTIIVPLRDLTKRHYCGGAMSSIFMDTNSDIYPCTNTIGIDYFKGGNIRENSFKDIWIDSEGFKRVRNDISVDNIVPCNKCEIRYICAGFCRGVNYQATGKVHAPFIWCNEVKKSIIEGMWTIAEFPNVFKNSKDKFSANTYEVI